MVTTATFDGRGAERVASNYDGFKEEKRIRENGKDSRTLGKRKGVKMHDL